MHLRNLALWGMTAALVGATSSALTSEASAARLTFDDDAAVQNGTIEHIVGGVATGSGIDFVSINGIGTPNNDGVVLTCDSCTLEFTTGALVTEGPNVWEWGAGGTFTLTGDAKNGAVTIASGTLVEGSFSSAIAAGLGNSLTFSGFGTDTKNEDLLNFYGLASTDFQFVNTELALGGASIQPNGSFSANIDNADFDNMPVPEPATLALIGAGLAGLGVAGRRRRRAAA